MANNELQLQATVVSKSAPTNGHGVLNIALFNPNGTPYTDTTATATLVLTGYAIAETGSAVAATDTVNAAIGKLEKRVTDTTTATLVLTDYAIAISGSAVAETDTVNAAIAKLEKRVYDIEHS